MTLRTLFSGDRADALQAEQAKLLYATLPVALTTNALLALVLLGTQSAVISASHLYLWIAIIVPVFAGRAALLFAWRRSGGAASSDCTGWLRRFRIAVTATGMAWGAAALLLFPHADIDHQSYLAFVIAGLSAGGISSLAVDRLSTFGFLLPMLLPLAARFGMEGDKLALSMGLMVMLFTAAIMVNAARGRKSLEENFQLRIKAEEQEHLLRESERHYRFLFANNPMPMWVFAEDTLRFLEVNNRAVEHYGYTLEEFSRITLRDIRPAEDMQNLAQTISNSPDGVITAEVRHKKKDGSLINVIVSTMPMMYGETHARIVLVQDITERKLIEARELDARKRAEELALSVAKSERFIKNIADHVPGMVGYWDRDLRCHFANRQYLEWFNKTPEAMSGITMQELMGESLFALNEPYIRKALAGEKQQFERSLKKADGSTGYTWANYIPDINADGTVNGFFVLVTDVTPLKLAEIESDLMRRNQNALLNAIRESTFLMDKDGTMLVVNEVGARRLNTTPEELIGKNVYEILPPEVAQTRRARFARIARTGIPESYEDVRAGRNLSNNIYPVHDASGEVSHFAVYSADVTQQRRVQAIEDLFSAINQKVLQGMPLPEVLTFICGEVGRLFDLSLIWVGRKETDGSVSIMAHAGAASGYVDGLKRLGLRWDDTPQGRGASGRTIRSGQVQITNPSDPGFKVWRELAREYDFQSMMGIPLLIRGEVYGAFTLYSTTPEFFSTPVTTDMLVGIATRISVALEAAMDQQQIRLLSSALAKTGNGVMITNPRGIIQWVNPAFARLSGYSGDELIGQTPRVLKSGQQSKEYYQTLWDTISRGHNWSSETVERAKDGRIYTVSQSITPMLDEEGKVTHYIAIHEDITAQKETRERIQYMAHYDALTGLPNRALFYDRLQQALILAKRNRGGLALLFMDLDGFKKVNDTQGHQAGDLLLVEVARRLSQCIRESDTVARLGGDEFTVILNNAHEQHSVSHIAEKIIAEISRPFDLGGESAHIGISIGISRYTEDASSEDELVKNADEAMYAAKSAGKNTYRFGSA